MYSLISPHRDAVWLAPVRTKPRRTYDGTKKAFSSEGDHTPYLLKKHLSSKASANRFRDLITDLGRDSHLFEDIKIRRFGRGDSSPFEVQVKLGGLALSISNVGYGVSQILPILAEAVTRPHNTVFHIQQPEVHLHPRAQAALGNLFYLLAREEQKSFVIETHSDFLIDRYRDALRSDNGDPSKKVDTSVLFFSRKKARNVAREMCFNLNGEYPNDQPKEFREFFIQEQMRTLGI
ncbi:MAG: AAA family ATPase [Limisphaerales bacterium]